MKRLKVNRDVDRLESKKDVEGLIKAFHRKKNFSVRARIVRALGEMRDAKALVTLIEAIRDADEDVGREAVEAFVKLGEVSLGILTATLDYPSHRVRCRAAEALGKLGDKRAVKALVKCLDVCRVGEFCARVCGALGEIGDEGAIVPLVEKVVLGGEGFMRYVAAFALRDIGDAAVDYMVERALNDKLWAVRYRIVDALGAMKVGRTVEPLLLLALEDVDPRVRQRAEVAIEMIGDAGAIALLRMLRDVWDREYGRVYDRIVDSLRSVGVLCAACGFPLPNDLRETGVHDRTCADNYYIVCRYCGYVNNLSDILGFRGCSEL